MELKFMTPMEVWMDYIPNMAPLETSTISAETDGNIVCTKLSFNAETTKEGCIRAYVEVYNDSRWADARAALMLLPSFRNTDTKDLVYSLVKEGYVVCIVDYCGGATNSVEKTTFPQELSFASFPECKEHLKTVETSARNTPWFVWTKIVRRALCLLENISLVDKSHIGIIGIREGAHIAWQAAAMDKRISALVSVGESGYRWASGMPRFTHGNVPNTDEQRAFMAGVGAETYAKMISCPVFMLASRTGNYADVDRVGDLFSIVKTDQKQLLITHGRESQITATALKVLLHWLRQCFVLRTGDNALSPVLTLENSDGKLYAKVETTSEAQFMRVYVCYGEEKSNARHWELFENLQKAGINSYSIAIPVYNTSDILAAYATCCYNDEDYASSAVQAIIPEQIGITVTDAQSESTRILYDGSMGLGSFECRTDETLLADDVLHQAVGPFNIKGITATKGALYFCRDAMEFAKLRNTSSLHFDVYSPFARDLYVSVYVYPEMKKFTACIKLKGGEFWQKIRLERESFKSKEGKMLTKFADAKILFISDVNGAIFNNFLWI